MESTFPQLVIVFCESQLSWALSVLKSEGVCHESHMFVAVKMQMGNEGYFINLNSHFVFKSLSLIRLYKTTHCLSDSIPTSFAMPLTTLAGTPTRLSQLSAGGTW